MTQKGTDSARKGNDAFAAVRAELKKSPLAVCIGLAGVIIALAGEPNTFVQLLTGALFAIPIGLISYPCLKWLFSHRRFSELSTDERAACVYSSLVSLLGSSVWLTTSLASLITHVLLQSDEIIVKGVVRLAGEENPEREQSNILFLWIASPWAVIIFSILTVSFALISIYIASWHAANFGNVRAPDAVSEQ